jgi:hypothetical protein
MTYLTESRPTLLVSQKRAEKRPCIERLKGEEIAYIPLVILTRKALEINHRDLTNRVTTSFTSVRNEADRIRRRETRP